MEELLKKLFINTGLTFVQALGFLQTNKLSNLKNWYDIPSLQRKQLDLFLNISNDYVHHNNYILLFPFLIKHTWQNKWQVLSLEKLSNYLIDRNLTELNKKGTRNHSIVWLAKCTYSLEIPELFSSSDIAFLKYLKMTSEERKKLLTLD